MSKTQTVSGALPPLAIGLLIASLLAAGFAGWLHFGSGIFLSLIESGLTYCF